MTDFIEGLEQDLVAAAERQARTGEAQAYAFAGGAASGRPDDGRSSHRRPGGRAVGARRLAWSVRAVAAAVAVFLSTAAVAAATLYTLRGAVIPAPAGVDVPREQTPVPSSAHLSALRVADPTHGAPPWTVRVARSDTGYVCSTVGQVVGGRFGLVGLDGRFRELASGLANSCGQEQQNAATLVGARVLSAKSPRDVRTVVSGVAGDHLRRVVVRSAETTRKLPVSSGGVFAAVYAGYPEDLGLEVTLSFADGHRQVEPLGVDPAVVLDPEGGGAWRAMSYMTSEDIRSCVSFGAARGSVGSPRSPGVCGVLQDRDGRGTRHGYFFAVRRLSSASARVVRPLTMAAGDWHRSAPRTAVWGGFGDDVRAVSVRAPGIPPRRVSIALGNAILGVLPASVRPADVEVRVEMKSGAIKTLHGDTNLVAKPVPRSAAAKRHDAAMAELHRTQEVRRTREASKAAPKRHEGDR